MGKAICLTASAAAELAANMNGIYFPLADGTFKVLWMED